MSADMNNRFHTIVIGGGPGGTPAAMQLAAQGKKVLLVEQSGKLGGACLFVGCIPSKIIKHAADQYEQLKNSSFAEKQGPEPVNDVWQEIRATMDHILSMRAGAAMTRIQQLSSLTFSSGTARFISNNEIELAEQGAGTNRYSFDSAIIATGSVPFVPEFKGNASGDVLRSEMIFKEKALPRSMLIIGGGPIGIELAQMLTKLNVKCSIIEMMDTILYGVVEPEFAAGLQEKLIKSGIKFYTSSRVLEVHRSGSCLNTIYVDKAGQTQAIQSEQVLASVGRVPNISELGLESTQVMHSRGGIEVNEFLETKVKGIYATGDVIQGPKFAHTATYEAHIAAANILLGNRMKADFSINSWVLFSDPEIASAGYTMEQAIKNGYEVITGTYDYRIDAAAQITGHPSGYLKFIVDKKTLRILGVHIFVEGANSIAGEAALIVSKKMTVHDVASAIHPHPTLTEAFGFLALNMLNKLSADTRKSLSSG